jgi:hypothetical protein
MQTISNYLEILVRETDKPESEIMSLAIKAGLQQLWREHILGQFLRQEISRAKAIDLVGIDWVELAERQYAAAQEDMGWAKQA